MNGQQRRHRSSSAPKSASDLATPRASNNSSGFHNLNRFHLSANDGDDFDSRRSSQEVRGRHPNITGSRKSQLDAMKMQHYQYQEDPHSKNNQQYMREQSRLQHHHRNYSEERQSTSECSRGSRSLIPQRDDRIAHWATPPRNYSPHDGTNGERFHSRHSDQLSSQEYYHIDNNLREGAPQRSKMKRSLSSGVVDMAKISFQSPQTKPPSVKYSKDDSYYGDMQQHETDQDSAGKKSKSSKGLLSRASHKIKKRLVGSSNSSSNGGDTKGMNGGVETFDHRVDSIDHRGHTSRLSVDISAVQFREGKDPSPSRNAEQSEWMHPLDDEHRRYGGNIPRTIYDDEGKLIEYFPSADYSESDMSTLTSNFTYPIGDLTVNHQGNRGRQIANEMSGTPPRAPRVIKGTGSSTKLPSNTKSSGLELQNTMHDDHSAEQGAKKIDVRTEPLLEKASNRDGSMLTSSSDASIEKVAAELHASLMKEMMAKTFVVQNDRSTQNNENDNAEIMDDLLRKQNIELVRVNAKLSTDIETLRQQQLSNDAHSSSTKISISQLETKVLRLEAQLRSKEQEISRTLKQNSAIAEELEKSHETAIQLTKDLDSYKKECASNRERVLQSERDNAKMEQLVFNERKKVLSLEAENEMLLNLADEKIGSANNSERATQSEMSAYKEQCKKYRDRVIQLERKVITSESALEATGKMASSLEQEKKSLSTTVEEYRTATKSLKAELDEKTTELLSVQEELSDLKSRWSTAEESIAQSKSRASDNEQTITSLESENYSLLRKLDAQSATIEKLQKELAQHKQLELDYLSLKKRNDELKLNEVELGKQLMDVQDAASNSGRLKKIVADNEKFISSLQNDLAQARSKHHQQLLEIRNKHSSEIDSLSDELQKEKQAKRETETKNNELEDKVLDLEAKCDQLEQQMSNQSLAHSDESSKLMRQIDELRERLSASRDETNELKLEITNKSHTHESLAAELRRCIETTEQQRDQFSSSASTLKQDLEARESDVKELRAVIDEKDRILNGLRSDLSEHDHQTNSDIGRLNEVINRLKQDLESSMSERQVLLKAKMSLQSQIQATKPLVLDSITSLRKEKATIASDIQTQLIEIKAEMIRHVKGEVLEYCRKTENQQLNRSMNHQVAVSEIRAENNKMELLLKEENNKAKRLQRSIDALHTEQDNLSTILKAACSKLSVPNKDLVDRLDDLLLEISDANSTVATLTVDLATTKAELTNKCHESHQLALDNDHLKKVLALTKAQVKETEADANDQNEKARSVIACLEQTLACKEQEWADARSSMDAEMMNLRNETSNEIATIRAEKQRLLSNLNESKEECKKLNSHLEEIQSELATSKNNVASLNDQLHDKTETIHNLNDLLSRAKGEADDKLANYYMKIEDELRAQLHSVQCEKESTERQMSMQNEESSRTLEELSTTKQELAACVDQLSADLDIAQKQVVTLKAEIDFLRKEKEQAYSDYANLQREIDSSSKQIQNLTSTIEKLNDVHVSAEREHMHITDDLIQRHSHEVEVLNTKLSEANSRIYELQSTLDDVSGEHSSDLKMSIEFYKSEMESLKASHCKELQDRNKEISDLRFEIGEVASSKSLLQESLKSAEEVCAERDDLIKQLKCSLRDALQNALQADASKRESEDKLAEITDTLSQYEQVELEESGSILSGSLPGSLHPKSTIERLVSDKQELESNLAQSERQLLECRSALNRLEAKLSMANKMNERLHEEASAHEHKLNQLADENKERLADQKWLEDRIKTMQAERQKEIKTYSEIVSRMQAELQKAKRNEAELVEQISVLRQDCEVENLYKELLDKMKRNEMQYESIIQKMTVENDSLRGRVTSIAKEKETLIQRHDETKAHSNSLARRLDEANAHSSTLTQRLVSVEDQLDTLRRNVTSKDALNDEVSTTSTLTSRHLQQTASELDTTIQAIKSHHATTVQKLQSELEDMRSKLKKSEKRVQELTKLLQENSKVIDALHKKLTNKKQHSKGNVAVAAVPSSFASSAAPSSSTEQI